jgi:hypothetical protein
MPADLKKVAGDVLSHFHSVNDYDAAFLESRLQTLVSEVRAQAMEEAAKIAEEHDYPTAQDIRRRASGKDESNA